MANHITGGKIEMETSGSRQQQICRSLPPYPTRKTNRHQAARRPSRRWTARLPQNPTVSFRLRDDSSVARAGQRRLTWSKVPRTRVMGHGQDS